MNAYKKTILALGIALTIVPQISNALDTSGIAITGALKTMYINNFMPNKILTNTDLTTWNTVVNGSFSNYITQNSTVAGISDTLLKESLNEAKSINSALKTALEAARKNYTSGDFYGMQNAVTALTKITNGITRREATLKKESYYIPSKKNAQEVLLTLLEFMRGAAETAIAKLKQETKVTNI
jgi:hypothetical protein